MVPPISQKLCSVQLLYFSLCFFHTPHLCKCFFLHQLLLQTFLLPPDCLNKDGFQASEGIVEIRANPAEMLIIILLVFTLCFYISSTYIKLKKKIHDSVSHKTTFKLHATVPKPCIQSHGRSLSCQDAQLVKGIFN